MDYYKKYLKYKIKYKNIKLLFGGTTIEKNNSMNVVLCGTHNNRLECFFRSIEKDYPEVAFNNCVVIRCFMDSNKLRFNMVYEGDGTFNAKYNKKPWTITTFNDFFQDRTYDIQLPENTEVLLIRHAVGVHNKMSLWEKIFNFNKDSQLDPEGITQAENVGIFLSGYLLNNNMTFMASSLLRTQQTIAVIMKKLDKKQPIYIVSCSHELNYVTDNGDEHILQKIPIASNLPKCKDNSDSCGLLTNFSGVDKYANYKVDINWNKFDSNNSCKNTNLLLEIIKILPTT